MGRPTIYVDADACPVKADILRLAERAGVTTVLVANGGLRPSRDPLVRVVIVPQGPDAADDWIAEAVGAEDIVVTNDIPLAQRVVEKGAQALGSSGRPFTPDSIGMARAMRDLKQDLRETGVIGGGNPAFSAKSRARFVEALANALQKALR